MTLINNQLSLHYVALECAMLDRVDGGKFENFWKTNYFNTYIIYQMDCLYIFTRSRECLRATAKHTQPQKINVRKSSFLFLKKINYFFVFFFYFFLILCPINSAPATSRNQARASKIVWYTKCIFRIIQTRECIEQGDFDCA